MGNFQHWTKLKIINIMPIMAMTCLVVVHVAFVLEGQLLNVGPIIAKLGKLLMACTTKRWLVKEGTIACCKTI
jgi:flagellar biosynthesis protein FlhB